MEITIAAVAGVRVVRFDGDFLSEGDHELFREKIRSLADEGVLHVVLDLAGVKYINSCGLGSLICALTTLRKTGGDIRLVGVGEHIREILEITRLNRTFEIYPSLKDALHELNVTMN